MKINPALEIAGILITMADMRTNYSREIVELLRGSYGSELRIFESIIPRSIRAAEISGELVEKVSLTELFPFKDHPFQVRDDEAMRKTVASIA